jgi:hypothetical protein
MTRRSPSDVNAARDIVDRHLGPHRRYPSVFATRNVRVGAAICVTLIGAALTVKIAAPTAGLPDIVLIAVPMIGAYLLLPVIANHCDGPNSDRDAAIRFAAGMLAVGHSAADVETRVVAAKTAGVHVTMLEPRLDI